MQEGIIIEGRGGLYYVTSPDGRVSILRARKIFHRQHISPLVGDRVIYTPGTVSDEHGWIEEILPRRNVSVRPPVANISILMIVAAPVPEPDWLLVDKLLIYAFRQNISPVIVINKSDLGEKTYNDAAAMYSGTGIPVFSVSTENKAGTEVLKNHIKGEVVCFCGQSGVGKSSLINCLCGSNLETGEISIRIERGKNTTRHTQLLIYPEFSIMDTPGFSLLDESEKPEDPVLLQTYYPEFADYVSQCRFQPCYHSNEPGCAVLEASKNGMINPDRVNRYHELLKASKERWNSRYD